MPRTSKKREAMLQVASYMDALQPDLIAVKLKMKKSTVEKYMKEILDGRMEAFKSKDYSALVESSHHNYERLKEEGWTLYLRSVDNKERAMALEKIRQAQTAEDQLFKLCGIYKEVNVTLNIEALMQTPQYQQMLAGIVDWIHLKGLDAAELFQYLEEREKNPQKEPDTITLEPTVTDEEKKRSGKTQDDDYERHRRERQYNRYKGVKDIRLGWKNRSAYQYTPEKLGVDEIHMLEAKEMLGTLSDIEKEYLAQIRKEKKDGEVDGEQEA